MMTYINYSMTLRTMETRTKNQHTIFFCIWEQSRGRHI
jgi:hypothetical protein